MGEPMMHINVPPQEYLEQFYNKCHDENGRFCEGPSGDGPDTPERLATIDKKGSSLARKYHGKQTDKTGHDYVGVHLTQVASSLPARLRLAGWLHDALEDTKATPESLRKDGVDENSIRIIKALTSPSGESKDKQLARVIKAGPDAIRVKLADTGNNLARSRQLPEGPLKDKLLAKYEPSIKQLEDALKTAEKGRVPTLTKEEVRAYEPREIDEIEKEG